MPGEDKDSHSEANLLQPHTLGSSSEAKPPSPLEPSVSCLIPAGFCEIDQVKVKWPKREAKLREVDLENWTDTLAAGSQWWLSGNSGTKSLT